MSSSLRKNADRFPLSRKRAEPNGFIGYVSGRDDPLTILHPTEALTAELFVLCQSDPRQMKTMRKPIRKWAGLHANHFVDSFREKFGFDLQASDRKGLEQNIAWRDYVEKLQTQTREAVMAKMRTDALQVYDDYTWSRTEARTQGDYKETRLAAADHLDRIGATEKPEVGAQNVIVVLRGRNFDEQTLMRELPVTEVEVVTVKEEKASL